jgi:hypothetical protein
MARVSFTGTRRGMQQIQRSRFSHLVSALFAADGDSEWHDGDCVGADDEAHQIVERIKLAYAKQGRTLRTIGHPGDTPQYYASNVFDESRDPKDNNERNHDMVDETEVLVACPHEMTEVQRSGTWATIRYCRKQMRTRTNLYLFIIFPDGTLKTEGPAMTEKERRRASVG